MTTPDTARREAYARTIGDSFSPNMTFDKSSSATQVACYRAADAILAKEQQALAEALARVEELENELRRLDETLKVTSEDFVARGPAFTLAACRRGREIIKPLLTTGARP